MSIKFNIAWTLNFLLFILLTAEASSANKNSQIKHIIQSLQRQYAPDRRTSVFEISYKHIPTGVVLIGEVDNLAAKTELISTIRRELKEEIIDSIQLLPDPILGNNKYGIVIVDVGNILRQPRIHGELVTQATMGAVLALLKRDGNYYFVQSDDRYLGWIKASSLFMTDQSGITQWNNSKKLIIIKLKCTVYKKPELSSTPIDTIISGCIVKKNRQNNGWTAIEFADGQTGFILDSVAENLEEWNKSRRLTDKDLEQTARTLLDIPYLWGGTSVKGMDCSGFTKIVYRFNGWELPRDADQQATQGITINPGKNFEGLQKGDLIFFCQRNNRKYSQRITHVGLWLGNRLFIHSSGHVRFSSFDPSSSYYDESLLKRFVRAQRIIKEP